MKTIPFEAVNDEVHKRKGMYYLPFVPEHTEVDAHIEIRERLTQMVCCALGLFCFSPHQYIARIAHFFTQVLG